MQQDHTQAHACSSRVLVLARQTHHPHEEDENVSVHDFLKYVFSFPYQRIIETSKFGIIKIRKNWEFSTTLRTWLCESSTSSFSSGQQSFCLDRRDYQHIFFSLVFGNFQHLAVSFSVSFGMFWRDATRGTPPLSTVLRFRTNPEAHESYWSHRLWQLSGQLWIPPFF